MSHRAADRLAVDMAAVIGTPLRCGACETVFIVSAEADGRPWCPACRTAPERNVFYVVPEPLPWPLDLVRKAVAAALGAPTPK